MRAHMQCRKVTTEPQTRNRSKKSEAAADSKSMNTSILCQMGVGWKPASA